MTRDIDIVASLVGRESSEVVRLLEDDYYVSADAVVDAIARRSMINVVHLDSVVRVDFIVRKDSEYRRIEFDRRQRIHVGKTRFWIVSKEDLILSKLSWAKESHSELQLRDVRNLLLAEPDLDYLNRWSSELRVDQLSKDLADE